jgi:tRNA threonylcarbamoyladenosine biosynthesis protein TsaB
VSPHALDRATILALDASTYVGTIAVLRGDRVLVEAEARMRGEHEERLMPAVVGALASAGVAADGIDAIVCGAGPGSFTSLRIAGSIAKGLATARGCPLYAVSSLALAVAGARPSPGAGRWLATLDAMRGERFAALVALDDAGRVIEEGHVARVPADGAEALARRLDARVLPHEHGLGAPHARGVAQLLQRIAEQGRVDLDAWEPDYGRLAEAQVKWEAAHGRPLAG